MSQSTAGGTASSNGTYSSLGRGLGRVWEYTGGRVALGDAGGQRWPQVFDGRPALRHACERPAPRVRVSAPLVRHLVREYFARERCPAVRIQGQRYESDYIRTRSVTGVRLAAEKVARRAASALGAFLPERLLFKLGCGDGDGGGGGDGGFVFAPRGNQLAGAWVKGGGSGGEGSESGRLVALFPRGRANDVLGLSCLDVGRFPVAAEDMLLSLRRRGEAKRKRRRGEPQGRELAVTPSNSAFLDVGEAIHQVQLADYSGDDGDGDGDGGRMVFAARGSGRIFCGAATLPEASRLSSPNLRLLSDVNAEDWLGTCPTDVCLSPYWPELAFATDSGELFVADIERAAAGGPQVTEDTLSHFLNSFFFLHDFCWRR